MKRPKKRSILAQTSTEIRSDAAVRLFPPKPLKIEDDPSTKDKDSDDSDNDIVNFIVEVALNGFLLTITYEDGSEVKYIHTDFDEVLKNMRTVF